MSLSNGKINLCDRNKRVSVSWQGNKEKPLCYSHTHLGNALPRLGKERDIEVTVRTIKQVASICQIWRGHSLIT